MLTLVLAKSITPIAICVAIKSLHAFELDLLITCPYTIMTCRIMLLQGLPLSPMCQLDAPIRLWILGAWHKACTHYACK